MRFTHFDFKTGRISDKNIINGGDYYLWIVFIHTQSSELSVEKQFFPQIYSADVISILKLLNASQVGQTPRQDKTSAQADGTLSGDPVNFR